MDKAKLALLRAELAAQTRQIEAIYNKIEERRRSQGQAELESLGYQLHNLYCAFEDLFEVVAGTFENQIDEEGRYHIELLRRLTVAIEGVRPALLSPECYRLLDNLRAFRHFFRHAYSFELDERKVRLVLDDALKLKDLYRGDLDRFLLALEE